MPDALIIAGHELKDMERAVLVRDYLKTECRMQVAKIVGAGYKSQDSLVDALFYRCVTAQARPLLIVYTGHGYEKGWAYGKEDAEKWLELSYRHVAAFCDERIGPTLFISDCCRSGNLSSALNAQGADPQRVGAIVSSTKKGGSYAELLYGVINSWRSRRPYVPEFRPADKFRKAPVRERRWGATLDHLFFPKS